MARTDQQAFLDAYLGGGISTSTSRQKIKSAGSTGVSNMEAGANYHIPSLYDYSDDIEQVAMAYVDAAQKQQEAAAKAAAKAAQKEAQKAKKQAEEDAEKAVQKTKSQESVLPSLASLQAQKEAAKSTSSAQKETAEDKTPGFFQKVGDALSSFGGGASRVASKISDNLDNALAALFPKVSTENAADFSQPGLSLTWQEANAMDAQQVPEWQKVQAEAAAQQAERVAEQAAENEAYRAYSRLDTKDKMDAQAILRTTITFGTEEEKAQAQKELAAVEKALWNDEGYLDLVQKSLDAEPEDSRINRYLDPSYKLNKLEEKDAKEIAESLLAESKEHYADMFATQEQRDEASMKRYYAQLLISKTSNLQAIGAGVLDAIPFFKEGVDKLSSWANEKIYPGEDLPTAADVFQNVQTQSPIAYTGGNVGGNLALYAAGSAAARSVPVLQKVGQAAAATPVAQTIQKVPVLGHLGTADAITGIVGDTAVDLAFDTLPSLGNDLIAYNRQQEAVNQGIAEGKTLEEMLPSLEEYQGEYLTPGGIAADTLKGIGTNLAFNLGGELVPELLKAGGRNLRQAFTPVPSLNDGVEAAAKAVGNTNVPSLDDAAQAAARTVNDAALPSLENAAQAAQSGADDVVNAWRSGTLTNAQLETLKPGGVNRAAFEQATGMQLPDTSSETRQFLRQSAEIPSLEPDMPAGTVASSVDNAYGSISAPVRQYENASNRVVTGGPEIPNGYKERGFAESIRTKTDLPDEVKQEFVDNPELYRAISNSETSARADAIYSQGLDRSMVEYNRMLSEKDPAAVPLGKKIADDLIAQGRRDEAVEVLRQMSQNLTQSGQFSQAAAIALLKNDPMTALQYIQKNIDRMNQEGLQKFGAKKWKNFSLTPEEIDGFSKIEYGDEDALKSAFEQIGKRIQRDYPVTTMQKLVEGTHVAMLLNPRTQIRNAVANLAFRPLNILSRKASAAGQNVYKFFNKDYQPTQALSLSKQSKALADDAYKMVRDTISGNVDGKWENTILDSKNSADVFKLRGDTNVVSRIPVLGDTFSSLGESLGRFSERVTGGKNVFEELSNEKSVAENIRRFTYGLLELGDEPFVRKEFVDRMASFIEARGYKSLDEVPQEAFDAATQSALKATFKDDNRLTRLVSGIKKNTGLLGEVAMPFTKTPANIAVRAFDYSPAGLAMGIRRWVKNGGDPSAYIDEISKGLTGTAAVGLGWLLYKAGIITGPASENQDQAQYDKMQGKLPYSIKIGNNYYTFDWMQPASSALILGSTLASEAEKDGGLDGQTIAEAFKRSAIAMGDTLLDMSPLQSLSDIFGGYGTPTENLLNEFVEFPQRLIPSALGAVARVADPVQRQTFSNGDTLATQIATAQSKIPGASQSLPAAYDTWGREITRADNLAEGIFNQFVNPGQTGNANPTPMDDEITRLFEATGQAGVFPQKANWSETYGGETHKLTNEQYSDYQRTMGQISYDGAFSLLDSEIYGLLDDQQKANAIQSVYAVGRDKALQGIFPDYSVPETRQKQVDVYDTLGAEGLADWLNYKAIADADENDSISQDEALAALNAIPSLDNDERAYFWYLTNSKWKKNPYM